ncbi:hypothetical protein PPS11_07935 [Pseudomonas putida S11]|nr:hypothetical protein PPS11_07935 [Pseudomonas putida S11]
MFAQVGGGRPGADEHIDLTCLLQFLGGLQCFSHRGVEDFDTGIGVVRREPGHHMGEPAPLLGALQVADQHDDLGGKSIHHGAYSYLKCFDIESIPCKYATSSLTFARR